MRVALVTPGGAYGSYAHAADLLLGGAQRDVEHVLVTTEDNPILALAQAQRLETFVFPFVAHSYDLRRAFGLSRILRRSRLDLVHGLAAFPTLGVVQIAGRLAGLPVVSHWTTQVAWNARRAVAVYQRRLEAKAASWPGRFVAMSRFLARQLEEAGVSRRRVEVIPHGVDVDAIASTPPSRIATRHAGPDIICVGHLSEVKRQHVAIRAMETIRRHHPDARLLLAGSDSQTHYAPGHRVVLERLAAELDLRDNVVFLGHLARQEVWRFLRTAHVAVHIPAGEGFRIAVTEAMAAGIPVVVSSAGALPELVRHGIDGLHVPVDDPLATGNAICRLLNDRALREQMGRAAQARARSEFSLAANLDRMRLLYDEVMR